MVLQVGETPQLGYERRVVRQGHPALVTAGAQPDSSRKSRLHRDGLKVGELDLEMTSSFELQRSCGNPDRPARLEELGAGAELADPDGQRPVAQTHAEARTQALCRSGDYRLLPRVAHGLQLDSQILGGIRHEIAK